MNAEHKVSDFRFSFGTLALAQDAYARENKCWDIKGYEPYISAVRWKVWEPAGSAEVVPDDVVLRYMFRSVEEAKHYISLHCWDTALQAVADDT